ncbi:MAG: glutamine synthetase, partial [Clostridia bacterium]|nr:glutamine synthetase [Clostridia bacterium]
DGSPFECDTRSFLERTVRLAEEQGLHFSFGSEMEFYLFTTDENGNATREPFDHATYMDIAPEDRGENVRREICLTLERMGIHPESSHHEEGPGQNEIDFRYSDPLKAADDAVTFVSVVKTIAGRSGLSVDFSPKPLPQFAGNGMHINFSVKSDDGADVMPSVIAGVLDHVREMTLFLNTTEDSYKRLGSCKAPRYVSWSRENRSQLIRIPAAEVEYRRAELRSPDPLCNPYLAYALIILAGLDGQKRKLSLPESVDKNLFECSPEETAGLKTLPLSLEKARKISSESGFLKEVLPASLLEAYLKTEKDR